MWDCRSHQPFLFIFWSNSLVLHFVLIFDKNILYPKWNKWRNFNLLFCRSSDYKDEIVWAATWIAKASKHSSDLQLAEKLYDDFKLKSEYDEFSWDSKEAGIDVWLARL